MSNGSLNKAMLIGHTGDDVKMHYFEGGGCVGRVSLATNEDYTNKETGERISKTEWHNLLFRNKAAEVVEKYLKKGDKVYIEGSINTRTWKDENGNDRYLKEIIVKEFTFLQSKRSDYSGGNSESAVDSYMQSKNKEEEEEDDLPF